MTTVGALIDETRAMLRTWITNTEQSTTLGGDLAADATEATLGATRDPALNASVGVLEIDRELIYASLIANDGTVTIPPWGRGYASTVAADHTTGTRVISAPLYPRQKILDALNDTLNRIFPTVFAVKHYNTTVTLPVITYNLPDDAQRVLTAEWQRPDGRDYWQAIRHWRINPGGRSTSAAGNNPQQGVTVDVADSMMPGRPIHFIYAAIPSAMDDETDDFATVTGLTQSTKDLIVYGAAAALVIPNETARLQVTSVEQQDRMSKISPSAALTASKFLEQKFQDRLAEEARTLNQLYPARMTGPWT